MLSSHSLIRQTVHGAVNHMEIRSSPRLQRCCYLYSRHFPSRARQNFIDKHLLYTSKKLSGVLLKAEEGMQTFVDVIRLIDFRKQTMIDVVR